MVGCAARALHLSRSQPLTWGFLEPQEVAEGRGVQPPPEAVTTIVAQEEWPATLTRSARWRPCRA